MKTKKIKSSINLQLILLIVLFVISFVVISVIHRYVNNTANKYDKIIVNYKNKSALGKILSVKLLIIENNFYLIANANRQGDIKRYSKEIYSSIKNIEEIIEILQNSGTYKEIIPVNIITQDEIQEVLSYQKNETGYILEVIELSTKISEIKSNTDELIKITTIKTQQKDSVIIQKLEIAFLLKQTNTNFKRTHETINKIFYNSTIKINEANLQKEKSDKRMQIVIYIVYVLLLQKKRGDNPENINTGK